MFVEPQKCRSSCGQRLYFIRYEKISECHRAFQGSVRCKFQSFYIRNCIFFVSKLYILNFYFQIAPFRYEPHKGLVDCYLATNRIKEALNIASNCCKADNNSPRALTVRISIFFAGNFFFLEKLKKFDFLRNYCRNC